MSGKPLALARIGCTQAGPGRRAARRGDPCSAPPPPPARQHTLGGAPPRPQPHKNRGETHALHKGGRGGHIHWAGRRAAPARRRTPRARYWPVGGHTQSGGASRTLPAAGMPGGAGRPPCAPSPSRPRGSRAPLRAARSRRAPCGRHRAPPRGAPPGAVPWRGCPGVDRSAAPRGPHAERWLRGLHYRPGRARVRARQQNGEGGGRERNAARGGGWSESRRALNTRAVAARGGAAPPCAAPTYLGRGRV